ncbi:hypothetical protein Tco_1074219 [Tanacetum coccineum]
MAQFGHTLKEDESKYRLTFMLDKKMLSLTLDDFRTIFHLPQATDNNHDDFVPPPSFFNMIPFYKNKLGFIMELKTSSSFKTTGLLQPWFTKIIISHYMTTFPEISRRARDIYHNLKDDDIMKIIFNSGRHKDKVGMKIPDWMISDEMKHTEHYRMYAEVFGIDVPLTQSQPTGRSTRVTPLALVPTVDKADEMILQDTLQVVDEPENVIDDSPIPRNDDQNIPGTRLEPRRDKESPEVEITNVVIQVNVNEEEHEITDEVSPRIHTDLVSSDTEKFQELTETDTTPTPTSSSLNTKLSTTNRLLSLFKAKPGRFKHYKSFFQELQGHYGYLFEHLKAKFLSRKSFDTLVDHLQEVMVESLPMMVDKHIKEQVAKQVPEQVKVQVPVYVAKGLILERYNTPIFTDSSES